MQLVWADGHVQNSDRLYQGAQCMTKRRVLVSRSLVNDPLVMVLMTGDFDELRPTDLKVFCSWKHDFVFTFRSAVALLLLIKAQLIYLSCSHHRIREPPLKSSKSCLSGVTMDSNTASWNSSLSRLASRTSGGHFKHLRTTSPYLLPLSLYT